MIISAPYRSGGTSLAIQLSKVNNLLFVGQLDNNSIEFTKVEDKNSIHEYHNQPMHTLDEVDSWLKDDTDVVILNNSNSALFHKTHTFIVRDDMLRCYTSIYWMLRKLYPMSPMQTEMLFKRITFFNGLLFTHLKRNNITALILEEQYWYTPTKEHYVDGPIKELAKKYVDYLKEIK